MKRVEFCGGVAMAVFAAGPVFVMTWIIAALIVQTPATAAEWTMIFWLLCMLLVAVPVGAAISLIPNLLGGALMAALGVGYPATRKREIWAIAGTILAMAFAAPFIGFEPAMLPLYLLFAFTGAICALIVRYGTRWSDDST